MLKGLNSKNGGPEKVTIVPGFFTGNLVEPARRMVAERVVKKKGEWKADGHVVSAHVDPEITRMQGVFTKEGKALVLEARDGHHYRLGVPTSG